MAFWSVICEVDGRVWMYRVALRIQLREIEWYWHIGSMVPDQWLSQWDVCGEESRECRPEAESKEKHSVWDPMPELTIHRKKRFTSFPSLAGMSLTKLPLGRNNSVMTSLFLPRESLVVTSRLGTGNWRTFFYGVTSPYVGTFTIGNPMPESTLSPSQIIWYIFGDSLW